MSHRSFIQPCRLLAALFAGALAGCSQGTKLETSWTDPSAREFHFRKVVVLVLNSTPGERRAQEDKLCEEIRRADAVSSYTFIPDADLRDSEKARKMIIARGFDGALVLRLVDARKQVTYTPAATSYWYNGQAYVPYESKAATFDTDTIVRAEISVYTVPQGKMLWVGSSTTTNPENARELAAEISHVAVEELRKQKLIP